MKVGRNSPCPCGSGKKYKRCCLSKEEEEQKKIFKQEEEQKEEERLEENEQDSHANVKTDKEQNFIDEVWEQFEKADYQGKISAFYKIMEKEENEEMASEMLEVIYQKSLEEDKGEKLKEVLENYQQKCPESYQANEVSYLMWQIEHVVAQEDWEKADSLVKKTMEHSNKDLQTYADLSELLAYYGKTSLLVDLMPLLWQGIEKLPSSHRGDLLDEIAFEVAFYTIFEHIEQNPESLDDLEELQQKIGKYASFDPEWIYRTIELLQGKNVPNWSADDFEIVYRSSKKKRKRDKAQEETGRKNLLFLSIDFLGYLYSENKISYSKGQLARAHLHRYILNRTVNIMQRNQRGKNRINSLNAELTIEINSIKEHLEPLQKEAQCYTLAAVVQMFPLWLQFLQERKLIDAQQHQETIEELSTIKKDVQDFLKKYLQNPTLEKDLQQSWEN